MRILLVMVLVAGCGRPDSLISQLSENSCAVVGAVPDDGLDDSSAIQAAVGLGCAHLGPGVFNITTPTPIIGQRRRYAMLSVSDGELAGDGPSTVLRFSGDAGGQDWYGVLLGTRGVLRDLRVSTGALVGTSEQTHAVRVTGPAQSPTILRLTCDHPRRGLPGGDCVQVVGYPGSEVVGMRIVDSVFEHADRSGVAVHSGASDLQITGCSFPDTGDVAVNFEGDGGVADVLISDDTFGPSVQSDWAIELDQSERVRITGVTTASSGVLVYNSSDVEVDHVAVRGSPSSEGGVVEVSKNSARVRVHDVTVERLAGSVPGPVIRAAPHGSGTPSALSIESSVLIQGTNSSAISSAGVVGLTVAGTVIRYSGTPLAASGIDVGGSTTTRADQVRVDGCEFRGPLRAALRVSGSRAGTGSVGALGNISDGPSQGLRCETIAGVVGPVTLVGNHWGPTVCGVPGFVTER